MPLSINVGLSRKASKDYQSTGYSINVTAELDQALLAKPGELQSQIDGLYAQAEDAINRQVNAHAAEAMPANTAGRMNGGSHHCGPVNGNGHANGSGNGYANGNGRTNGNHNGGGVTKSQARAIESIADRAGLDPSQEAHDLFGVSLDELSIKQASELIDHLKSQAPTQNGHSRRWSAAR
ncbi:MAG: hypothetical protein FWD61_09225 [Phycisphaerales bacterium]|nr:hypothetical protein [Phycisphaerales bacterium]